MGLTRKTLRFIITSMIHTLHDSDLSDNEIENVINTELNMVVNMLKPEYSVVFIEELLAISGNIETLRTIEKQEVIDEIIANMKDI